MDNPLQHKSLLLFTGKKVIVAKICSKGNVSHNLPPCLVCGHYTTGGGKMQRQIARIFAANFGGNVGYGH
jgi:hypothetical protein